MRLPVINKSNKGTLPNLIIIGAQKCATTSLHYYLNLHPQISMSREKELNFFALEFNWHKGIGWYKSNFIGQAKIHGESSPGYTCYPLFSGVPERMHAVVPEAKLIYVLRDPIERIISHYIHRYASGKEHRQIAEALADLGSNPYVCRSKYYMQLEQYLDYFLPSHILILTREDLYRYRRETLQQVFRFLDVDYTFFSRRFSRVKHPSRHKRRKTSIGNFLARTPVMDAVTRLPFEIRGKVETLLYFPFSRKITRPTLDENLREALIDYLADDINRLRAYTGRDFEEWCL